eukprot:TRINITY_DN11982_c0_g1_i1.p1 TRINITY_DN11982_c0_g1~~TRINITY_DN11982_c0_g1_i1.p1  ORF type:complete len:993 (+),score=176.92 TRINITY_DN11982_c0_g1_i1:156-3134(+)
MQWPSSYQCSNLLMTSLTGQVHQNLQLQAEVQALQSQVQALKAQSLALKDEVNDLLISKILAEHEAEKNRLELVEQTKKLENFTKAPWLTYENGSGRTQTDRLKACLLDKDTGKAWHGLLGGENVFAAQLRVRINPERQYKSRGTKDFTVSSALQELGQQIEGALSATIRHPEPEGVVSPAHYQTPLCDEGKRLFKIKHDEQMEIAELRAQKLEVVSQNTDVTLELTAEMIEKYLAMTPEEREGLKVTNFFASKQARREIGEGQKLMLHVMNKILNHSCSRKVTESIIGSFTRYLKNVTVEDFRVCERLLTAFVIEYLVMEAVGKDGCPIQSYVSSRNAQESTAVVDNELAQHQAMDVGDDSADTTATATSAAQTNIEAAANDSAEFLVDDLIENPDDPDSPIVEDVEEEPALTSSRPAQDGIEHTTVNIPHLLTLLLLSVETGREMGEIIHRTGVFPMMLASDGRNTFGNGLNQVLSMLAFVDREQDTTPAVTVALGTCKETAENVRVVLECTVKQLEQLRKNGLNFFGVRIPCVLSHNNDAKMFNLLTGNSPHNQQGSSCGMCDLPKEEYQSDRDGLPRTAETEDGCIGADGNMRFNTLSVLLYETDEHGNTVPLPYEDLFRPDILHFEINGAQYVLATTLLTLSDRKLTLAQVNKFLKSLVARDESGNVIMLNGKLQPAAVPKGCKIELFKKSDSVEGNLGTYGIRVPNAQFTWICLHHLHWEKLATFETPDTDDKGDNADELAADPQLPAKKGKRLSQSRNATGRKSRSKAEKKGRSSVLKKAAEAQRARKKSRAKSVHSSRRLGDTALELKLCVDLFNNVRRMIHTNDADYSFGEELFQVAARILRNVLDRARNSYYVHVLDKHLWHMHQKFDLHKSSLQFLERRQGVQKAMLKVASANGGFGMPVSNVVVVKELKGMAIRALIGNLRYEKKSLQNAPKSPAEKWPACCICAIMKRMQESNLPEDLKQELAVCPLQGQHQAWCAVSQ